MSTSSKSTQDQIYTHFLANPTAILRSSFFAKRFDLSPNTASTYMYNLFKEGKLTRCKAADVTQGMVYEYRLGSGKPALELQPLYKAPPGRPRRDEGQAKPPSHFGPGEDPSPGPAALSVLTSAAWPGTVTGSNADPDLDTDPETDTPEPKPAWPAHLPAREPYDQAHDELGEGAPSKLQSVTATTASPPVPVPAAPAPTGTNARAHAPAVVQKSAAFRAALYSDGALWIQLSDGNQVDVKPEDFRQLWHYLRTLLGEVNDDVLATMRAAA